MLDDYIAMASDLRWLTRRFPNSQKTDYPMQVQQCYGS